MVSNDPHFTDKKTEPEECTCPPKSPNQQFRLRVKSIASFIHSFKYYNYSNFKPHTERRPQRRNIYGKYCVPVFHGTKKKEKKKGGGKEGGKQRRKIIEINQGLLRLSIQIKLEMSALVDILYFYPTLHTLGREPLLNVQYINPIPSAAHETHSQGSRLRTTIY